MDPFVYSPYNLVEAGYGFACGDFCSDDPKHENLAFLGGWLFSGYLVIGDLRDLPSAVIKGDSLNFVLTGVALVPYIGDAESTLTKLIKMAGKSDKMILETFEMVAKSDELKPLLIRVVDAVTGGAGTILKESYGFLDDLVRKYAGEGIHVGKVREGLDGLVAEHISKGSKLSQKTAGMAGKFDEPITDIRFAGKGGEGSDIVVTMKDGRTIGREVTTLQPKDVPLSVDDFTRKLKDTIAGKSKQLTDAPENLKDLHVQINKGENFANKDTLLKSIERAKGTLNSDGYPYVFNKIVLYDGAGNILAIG